MAPEMKDGLVRQEVVFGMRYVRQCQFDTKILLFMGSFGNTQGYRLGLKKEKKKMP